MHPVISNRKLPILQLSIFQQNYPPHIVIWGGGLHFNLFYKFYIYFGCSTKNVSSFLYQTILILLTTLCTIFS